MHHLLLAGPRLAGVVSGLLAPLIASQPGLRIALLDTADGAMALDLADVPQRLPTSDGGDVQELLGVLGSLHDPQAPVLVVVYAEDAAACEAAVIPLMRAASYLPLSLVVAAPDEQALPEVLRTRLPMIRVRNRQAHWQAPHGHWRWAMPTLLRLPWRDPAQPWPLPAAPAVPGGGLPPAAGFWAMPEELSALIDVPDAAAPAPDGEVIGERGTDQSEMDVAGHASPAETGPATDEEGTRGSTPEGDQRVDGAGRLIVDSPLLAAALQWAASADSGPGITLKGLAAGLQLPSRVAAAQLVDTLLAAGLGAQTRDGWYRLLSVADAVASGKLPPGPWHVTLNAAAVAFDEGVVDADAASSRMWDAQTRDAATVPAPDTGARARVQEDV